MNQPTRVEMLETIRIYSERKHSQLVEYANGIRRHQITPLFRIEFLGEKSKIFTQSVAHI